MSKDEYKPYICSLVRFMVKNGYTSKPLPKVVLRDEEQEGVFISTAHYVISEKKVVLYINGRHPKDVLRSLAHELIHHKQNLEGRLTEDIANYGCLEDNDELLPLEEEAYMKGNVAFRLWTENNRIRLQLQETTI